MIESPCIRVCVIDQAHGMCAGCYRTLDEIGDWLQMSDQQRAEVLAELPERRALVEADTAL